MSKKHKQARLGILFTNELTDKINHMSNLTGFFDPAKFVYYLVDKEYAALIKNFDDSDGGDEQ